MFVRWLFHLSAFGVYFIFVASKIWMCDTYMLNIHRNTAPVFSSLSPDTVYRSALTKAVHISLNCYYRFISGFIIFILVRQRLLWAFTFWASYSHYYFLVCVKLQCEPHQHRKIYVATISLGHTYTHTHPPYQHTM